MRGLGRQRNRVFLGNSVLPSSPRSGKSLDADRRELLHDISETRDAAHLPAGDRAGTEFETFVVTKHRQSEEKFPFDDIEMAPDVRSNFVRRFWLKYVKHEPPIVYRGEYGVLNRLLERSAGRT